MYGKGPGRLLAISIRSKNKYPYPKTLQIARSSYFLLKQKVGESNPNHRFYISNYYLLSFGSQKNHYLPPYFYNFFLLLYFKLIKRKSHYLHSVTGADSISPGLYQGPCLLIIMNSPRSFYTKFLTDYSSH